MKTLKELIEEHKANINDEIQICIDNSDDWRVKEPSFYWINMNSFESHEEFLQFWHAINSVCDWFIADTCGISRNISVLSDEFKKYLELCENYDLETVQAYADEYLSLDDFEDSYQGDYNDFEEFAEQIFRDCYDIPERLEYYIDWKAVAHDMAYDYTMIGRSVFANY